jgi:hypothetical protein
MPKDNIKPIVSKIGISILVILISGCSCPIEDQYRCNDNIGGWCCKTHIFDDAFKTMEVKQDNRNSSP